MLKVMALHAGNADGTDFFIVSQNANSSLGRGINGEQSLQLGVSTHAVVMAVSADQAAVKANLTAAAGRDDNQFCGLEVGLDQAVLFVQPLHDVQLYQIGTLALDGFGTQNDVQLLTGDALCQSLLHLVSCQVGQRSVTIRIGSLSSSPMVMVMTLPS